MPLGTFALTNLPERLVLGVLGAVLLSYTAFELSGVLRNNAEDGPPVRRDPAYVGASIAGFLSGILGAAYATNGLPRLSMPVCAVGRAASSSRCCRACF